MSAEPLTPEEERDLRHALDDAHLYDWRDDKEWIGRIWATLDAARARIADFKAWYEAEREIKRLRPVVEAAMAWHTAAGDDSAVVNELAAAVDAYRAQEGVMPVGSQRGHAVTGGAHPSPRESAYEIVERGIPGADAVAFHVMRVEDWKEMGRFLLRCDAERCYDDLRRQP